MKKMMINGLKVTSEPWVKASEKGEFLCIPGMCKTSVKVSTGYTEIENEFKICCAGDVKARAERMKIKTGSSLSIVGNYTVSVVQKEGKSAPVIFVFADDIEYSTGAIGTTGTLSVWGTDMGICTDVHTIPSGGYVDAAYNTGYGENRKTDYIRLLFSGTPNALVQKGKRIDVTGRWTVNITEKDDGKVYINQTICTGANNYNKAPFTKRDSSSAPSASAPAAEASPAVPSEAPAAAPTPSSLSLEGFEEIGDNVAFF